MLLGIFGWLVVGLVVGFLASRFVNLRGDDPLVGILCGLGGAIAGGVMFALISGRGVLAWDPWALLASAAGGVLAVVIYHAVRSRSISRETQSYRRSY